MLCRLYTDISPQKSSKWSPKNFIAPSFLQIPFLELLIERAHHKIFHFYQCFQGTVASYFHRPHCLSPICWVVHCLTISVKDWRLNTATEGGGGSKIKKRYSIVKSERRLKVGFWGSFLSYLYVKSKVQKTNNAYNIGLYKEKYDA